MRSPRRKRPRARHGHAKAFCLKVLRRLSAYVDGELSRDVCREIRTHLGACPKCEMFLDSLRQTVALCRHSPAHRLSPRHRARLRLEILKGIGAR